MAKAFNIGFRDINFGRWIRLLMKREYDIRPIGWVRTVSGMQSLVTVYLVALWVLTYFGRPFDQRPSSSAPSLITERSPCGILPLMRPRSLLILVLVLVTAVPVWGVVARLDADGEPSRPEHLRDQSCRNRVDRAQSSDSRCCMQSTLRSVALPASGLEDHYR